MALKKIPSFKEFVNKQNDTLVISWEQTKMSELPENDDTYFYAFSYGQTLYYIGMTYLQHVKDEIKQKKREFKFSDKGLVVWLGYIDRTTKHKSVFKTVSKKIILNSECLLIYENQPSKNTACKKNYTGRPVLKVISYNFPLIYDIVYANNGKTGHRKLKS